MFVPEPFLFGCKGDGDMMNSLHRDKGGFKTKPKPAFMFFFPARLVFLLLLVSEGWRDAGLLCVLVSRESWIISRVSRSYLA